MKNISSKSLINMPIYSLNDGEILGNVKNIIVDPKEKCLLGIVISPKGWYRDLKIVPRTKVQSLGTQGITIDEKSSAQRASNLPKMLEYLHKPAKILGSKIITESGDNLGRVDEYFFHSENFSISKIHITQNNFSKVGSKLLGGTKCISGEYIETIGNGLIVLNIATDVDLELTPSIIGSNFSTAREKANKIWQNSLENTQHISKNVQDIIYEQRKKLILAKSKHENVANPVNMCSSEHLDASPEIHNNITSISTKNASNSVV